MSLTVGSHHANIVIVCAGNFPWLLPVIRIIVQQTERMKYFQHLNKTALMLAQERRKEKEPGKV